jgi:hypothetical protein
MQGLSAAKILEAWERGQGRSSVERALALLAAGLPSSRPADLAELSLGRRDLLLLRLRELTLGSTLKGYANCPRCGVTIDFSVLVDDVWFPAPRLAAGEQGERLTTADGWEVEFRLPNSRDLAAAAGCRGVEEARGLLLGRTIVAARHRGREVAAGELPPEVVAAVAERLEACDPQAETPLALACARCGHRWQLLLDIAAFLWSEVAALAERLLLDVHALARFYGWSEAEIIAMSAARREFYLEHAASR